MKLQYCPGKGEIFGNYVLRCMFLDKLHHHISKLMRIYTEQLGTVIINAIIVTFFPLSFDWKGTYKIKLKKNSA